MGPAGRSFSRSLVRAWNPAVERTALDRNEVVALSHWNRTQADTLTPARAGAGGRKARGQISFAHPRVSSTDARYTAYSYSRE